MGEADNPKDTSGPAVPADTSTGVRFDELSFGMNADRAKACVVHNRGTNANKLRRNEPIQSRFTPSSQFELKIKHTTMHTRAR
jgi:hypothetical protein